MTDVIVWLNTEFAQLFFLGDNSISVEKIVLKPLPNEENHQLLFLQTLEGLRAAETSAVVVIGPDKTHEDFLKFMKMHFPQLRDQVVMVSQIPGVRESEILSFGQTLLQKHYKTKT